MSGGGSLADEQFEQVVKRMTAEQRERFTVAEKTADLLDCALSFFPDDDGGYWAVVPNGSTMPSFKTRSIDEAWEWLADEYDHEQSASE